MSVRAGRLVGPVKSLVTKVIGHVGGRSGSPITDLVTFRPPRATLARRRRAMCIACIGCAYRAGSRRGEVCTSTSRVLACSSATYLAGVPVLLGRGYGERGRLLLHTAPTWGSPSSRKKVPRRSKDLSNHAALARLLSPLSSSSWRSRCPGEWTNGLIRRICS